MQRAPTCRTAAPVPEAGEGKPPPRAGAARGAPPSAGPRGRGPPPAGCGRRGPRGWAEDEDEEEDDDDEEEEKEGLSGAPACERLLRIAGAGSPLLFVHGTPVL
ncbi:unnamed protein product [Prorocentrum cordatum]|uniref:Uncharacterized protein n=1 Tax=Prorocentrum cordatum TaxID=2364126 RepID=A0ABN9VLX5_9DINO|nr:unnamed protein product [Polarella glacialis]